MSNPLQIVLDAESGAEETGEPWLDSYYGILRWDSSTRWRV